MVDKTIITKEMKLFLEKKRSDYIENLSRIKPDLENYHEAAFNKFIYQFHKTISEILKLKDNLTVDELGEYMKKLSSKIYAMSRTIKDREDDLLKEKNKKSFARVQSEIHELSEEKKYFGILEKNISRHNLIMNLQEIVDKINWIGFSGEKVQKEIAAEVINKSEEYIRNLTETADQKEGFFSHMFGHEIAPEKPNDLSASDIEFIKHKVGIEHYNRFSSPIIDYINTKKGNKSYKDIMQIFIARGWPSEFVKPTFDCIMEIKS